VLQFGTLRGDEQEIKSFTVTNIGPTTLTVDSVGINTGSESFRVVTTLLNFELETDESQVIDVMFEPALANGNTGTALVVSNDEANPEVTVQLIGEGTVPELLLTPEDHDFGEGFIPCDEELVLTLENIGNEDLIVDAIRFDGEQMDLIGGNIAPLTLAPSESTTVDVIYTALETGSAWGEVAVSSNDPLGVKIANQRAETSYARSSEDTFEVPVDPPVDILCAVDQSCSLDAISQDLGDAFDDFIDQIDTVTQGWQIGVVTLDSGCFNSGILRSTTPNYQQLFSNAVKEGYDGSGNGSNSEKLYAMVEGSMAKMGPGQCNDGFLRPGAMLHVIFVSDEQDRSPQSWNSYLASYSATMGIATTPNPLLLASVIGDLNRNCGDRTGLGQYEDGVDYTGGLKLNVCSSAWSGQVDQLALASLAGIGDYVLASANPDSTTINVEVDGVDWPADWHYAADTNSIVFDVPLEGGEEIVVSYDVFATCN
jgi:hypothetical protein